MPNMTVGQWQQGGDGYHRSFEVISGDHVYLIFGDPPCDSHSVVLRYDSSQIMKVGDIFVVLLGEVGNLFILVLGEIGDMVVVVLGHNSC
jgi:hypothetical protein